MDSIQDLLGKRAIDVTVDELATVIATKLVSMQSPKKETRLIKGVNGIKELLQCSRSKASRLHTSGILDSAIVSKSGRIILFDSDKVLDVLKQHKGGRRYTRGLSN